VTHQVSPSLHQASRSRRGALLIGLAALLPLVALAIIAVMSTLGAYRAADEARLRGTARALAAAVDAELGTVLAALNTLASSDQLDRALDAHAFAARSRPVGDLFGGWVVLLGPAPEYRVLALSSQIDQDTLPIALPPENRRAIQPLLTEVYDHGRAGISDLFDGAVVRRQIITAMVPIIRDGHPPRGLALSFEPSSLRALLARQDLPRGTFAAVADGQYRILAHSFDPEGRRVGVQAPDWVAAAVQGQQSALLVGPGWQGRDNVYAVERVRLAPDWTVTVAEPVALQRASAWEAVRWLLAGGAALGLCLAVVVWAHRREAVQDARREAEALRVGRADVERLHGGLPAVIFLREMANDGTSRLVYRGGDLETVTGWPARAVAGRRHFDDLVHPEDSTFTRLGPRLLREGSASYQWRMRQPDGSWRVMHTLARVLTRRADGGAEIVGYTVDISARRDAEARALSAARLASLGEMSAGLAHEMKQPLQIISLAAEGIQRALSEGRTADIDRRVSRIVQHTQRSAQVIDRLRRFARGADDEAVAEAVSLGAAIESAMALVHSTLRDADIAVEVAMSDPGSIVRGQAVLLEQVLANLLLNARDAMSARPVEEPRRIRIATAPRPDGTVELTVADTGGGIAPHVMTRVFEPFVTTKGPDKGTGLGLSICHGLIKGMGGTIEVHNAAEGAVFTITLVAASEGEVTAESGGQVATMLREARESTV
jgi:C4-dicarboxylate-specific signal transduction histidine kinase